MSSRIRNLNRNEVMLLNFSWGQGGLLALGSHYTMYAASPEGIYRVVNADQILSRYRNMLTKILKYIGIPEAVIIVGIVVFLVYQEVIKHIAFTFYYFHIVTIIVILMAVYGIVGGFIILKRTPPVPIIGELVVTWNEVGKIDVTNVRRVDVNSSESDTDNNQNTIEVGDWHVLTYTGAEITIRDVTDPYFKLKILKRKFGLNI
ncbi:hypothetical protein [Stygiolobus caldivivus]|uniref:Conjugative plasmid protein (PARN3) n=1 Tax=Stygiolobus caldivivus TaxID=2824673 RepID=A0A8D5U9T3_9CREN|nr:hypothetical protein [Stygiolobus caldivivus]BCU71675.1 conjugative plasmid protein (pARN3) [Stygiolobus caldivivus]